MSYNAPNPNGSGHTVAHATVILIDPATGLAVAPGGGSGGGTLDSGVKVTAVAALPAGGTGLIGWLSNIWDKLNGTLVVSGPLTDTQLRATAVPVTTGQITSVTATIASGASVSADIDLGAARLGRIALPAAWTAADLTLQTSHDNVNWNNLYDAAGAEYTIKAAAARSVLVPLSDMLSVRYLRLRSGTAALPVVQTAARSLILVLVP